MHNFSLVPRCILTCCLLLGAAPGAQSQDTLITKNKGMLLGYFVEQRNDSLYFYEGPSKSSERKQLAISELEEWNAEDAPKSIDKPALIAPAKTPFAEIIARSDSIGIRARNAVSLQFLGAGAFLSVQYHRLLWESKERKAFFSLGLGLSAVPKGMGFPHSFSFGLGKKRHSVELGVSGVLALGRFREWDWSGDSNMVSIYGLAPLVGYRFQPARGFFFRVHFCPTFFLHDGSERLPLALPYIGLDLGYAF